MADNKLTRISDAVASQLPDFIQNDYGTFVSFLQAYYKYLDQQKATRNLEYLKDVDKTLDEFIGNIKSEVALLAPQLAHDRFFLKNTKASYVTRGSEESYACLFRLLYNKEIEIEYPGEKMFKVSGGEWLQDTSFYLKITSGDPTVLENNYHYVTGTDNGRPRLTRVYVKKVQRVESHEGVWEIFIALNYYGKINVGDSFNSSGVVGVVEPSTTKVRILRPGANFKIGEVFNIGTSLASGLLVKVVQVDANGGLKRLQVIGFGYGFKKDFIYNIIKVVDPVDSVSVSNLSINPKDNIFSQTDYGSVLKQTYHSGYVENNYAGQILADFYDQSVPEDQEQVVASIYVELGAVNKYPGYYQTAHSLISDDSYIQDGEYYQDFSYIIKIDEKLDAYRDTVLSCLHPVGRKLFGNYLIETDFDLEIAISNPVIRILIPQFSESVEAVEMLDKLIASVVNITITGDGTTTSFDIFDGLITFAMLFVRKDGVTLSSPTDWVIFGENIEFVTPPAAGEKIQIRYAVLNFSGSASFQSAIFDVEKPLFDQTPGSTDLISAKDFVKRLMPAYGNGDSFDLSTSTIKDTFKALPTVEMLASGATQNEKDSFVMGDTGTEEGADPETNLTIKDVVKPLLDIPSLLDSAIKDISKPLFTTQLVEDQTETKAFTKVLTAANGYNSQSLVSHATEIKDVFKALATSLDSSLFDEVRTFNMTKIADADSFSLSTSHTYSFSKSVTGQDSAAPSDSDPTKQVSKALTDSTNTPTDSGVYSFIMATIDESSTALDSSVYSLTLTTINESFTQSDTVNSKDSIKALSDSAINTDTGFLEFNPFDSTGTYFAQEYITGRTNF